MADAHLQEAYRSSTLRLYNHRLDAIGQVPGFEALRDRARVLKREVIEHLDAARLATFERIVFEFARPRHVVLTTPNAEYNAVFGTLPAGEFRHGDHRFEWKRSEFETWANGVADRSDDSR